MFCLNSFTNIFLNFVIVNHPIQHQKCGGNLKSDGGMEIFEEKYCFEYVCSHHYWQIEIKN